MADHTHHLEPADAADFQIATDLGRKAGQDVSAIIIRTMKLGMSPYQREVVALAGAVAGVACARNALRMGSAPDASYRDVLEAIVEMIGDAESTSPDAQS